MGRDILWVLVLSTGWEIKAILWISKSTNHYSNWQKLKYSPGVVANSRAPTRQRGTMAGIIEIIFFEDHNWELQIIPKEHIIQLHNCDLLNHYQLAIKTLCHIVKYQKHMILCQRKFLFHPLKISEICVSEEQWHFQSKAKSRLSTDQIWRQAWRAWWWWSWCRRLLSSTWWRPCCTAQLMEDVTSEYGGFSCFTDSTPAPDTRRTLKKSSTLVFCPSQRWKLQLEKSCKHLWPRQVSKILKLHSWYIPLTQLSWMSSH